VQKIKRANEIEALERSSTLASTNTFLFHSRSSVSLAMVSRGVFESYYVSLSRFVMLVVILLDGLRSWRLPSTNS